MINSKQTIKTLFEKSCPGSNRGRYIGSLSSDDFNPADVLGQAAFALADRPLPLPELGEAEVVRHYTRLSQRNFSLDANFYPLGSCTMKYNPRINEQIATKMTNLHPMAPDWAVSGALEMMWELQEFLTEISGLDAITLTPAAGAHGELTALKMIVAYHRSRGENRTKVLIPDSAHGTNPASCTLCGRAAESVKSLPNGRICLEDLKEKLDDQTAAMMITNPNTLGLFESDIAEIAELVHAAGAMLYLDGANMNAIMGITRPGDFGADAMHFNLHKTFSTPHGGGGPGAGPVAVCKELAEFLPVPVVEKKDDKFSLNWNVEKTIGMVRSFSGQFAVLLRAWSYIRSLGADGLAKVSETAVISANYLAEQLKKVLPLEHDEPCMHEFVLSGCPHGSADRGLAGKIGKALLDHGFHAPTVYFPLIVNEALMIEPTETESLETLDEFIEAVKQIADRLQEDSHSLDSSPNNCPVDKVDEIAAARNPILSQ